MLPEAWHWIFSYYRLFHVRLSLHLTAEIHLFLLFALSLVYAILTH